MARSIVALLALLSVTTSPAMAQEVSDEVVSAAQEAGVDPIQLAGASNTTGLEPKEYLFQTGELQRPVPAPQFGPGVDARAWCVEGIESHHGAAMYNSTPVWNGEHAQGYLGWLPSTARSVGVTIGNRVSEWAGFRRMLSAGRGAEFAGIAWGIC